MGARLVATSTPVDSDLVATSTPVDSALADTVTFSIIIRWFLQQIA